jgi:TorA maturation chaperone TorD
MGALVLSNGVTQSSPSDRDQLLARSPTPSMENVAAVDHADAGADRDNGGRQARSIDETDTARAREYALLAVLLRRPPDSQMLAQLAALEGDRSPLGVAHADLGIAAAATNAEQVEREFFNLFTGIGRGELMPYGSYYLTGFLNERPLARLRDHLRQLGIERVAGEPEPEDHAAILYESMAHLAGGSLGTPAGSDRDLFEKHLSPWLRRFFADLEQAKSAKLYRRVGTVGRLFIGIEEEAFALMH